VDSKEVMNRRQAFAAPRVVILEDDIVLSKAFERVLVSLGFVVTVVHTIADARLAIRDVSPELIMLDISLPDGNGLDLMSELGVSARRRFIVISGDNSQRAAIKSIRHQAVELLIKPVSLDELRQCIRRVVATAEEQRGQVCSSRTAIDDNKNSQCVKRYPSFWIEHGTSSVLRNLRVSASLSAERRRGRTLIIGAQGTAKCEVARAVHYRARRMGQCVIVDCRQVYGDISTRAFFGEIDPANGESVHPGYIEQARGGTLVLNHVQYLSASVQSALIAFFDTGYFRPTFSAYSVSAVVAVVGIVQSSTANNTTKIAPLRADFKHRLAQVTLRVPSLGQCVGDVVTIAQFILDNMVEAGQAPVQLSQNSMSTLSESRWPGNVEQLRQVIEESLKKHVKGEPLELHPEQLLVAGSPKTAIEPYIGRSLEELERELFLATLDFHDGDRRAVAKTLGISLKTLYNRLHVYPSVS